MGKKSNSSKTLIPVVGQRSTAPSIRPRRKRRGIRRRTPLLLRRHDEQWQDAVASSARRASARYGDGLNVVLVRITYN